MLSQGMVSVTPLDSLQRIFATISWMSQNLIIELEVLDKRETSMKSVQMEKQALHNVLHTLRRLLTITKL